MIDLITVKEATSYIQKELNVDIPLHTMYAFIKAVSPQKDMNFKITHLQFDMLRSLIANWIK
jgi:hypothetical protein